MILLIGVAAGLLSGLLRATLNKKPYQPYSLRLVWLVLFAVAAQWFAFSFPLPRASLSETAIRLTLVLSQLMLLVFVVGNRKTPGFWLLGLGLVLNLTVIVLNGGLMPVSPETVNWLMPNSQVDSWQIGERLGYGKDVVLPRGDTILWFLSDQIRTPSWLPVRVAFSLGDIFIALGAFWLFWSIGGRAKSTSLQEKYHVTTDLPPNN
ncbi:MAG: DUF5317 domain-containing protein [Bellilinea sp.]|jgi:hypothetical protein